MTRSLSTRVFSRLAAAAVLFAAFFTPPSAEAAPITLQHTLSAPATAIELDGSFTFDNDIALFSFLLGPGQYDFLAQTTSYAAGDFDPSLALYAGRLGDTDASLMTYLGPDSVAYPALNDDDISPDALLQFSLGVDSEAWFTLALTQSGNFAHEDMTFDWDHDNFQCGTTGESSCEVGAETGHFVDFTGEPRGSNYALTLAVTPVEPASVPEPGTLALMGLGAGAAALARRRHSRR